MRYLLTRIVHFLALALLPCTCVIAQSIQGIVEDEARQPVPFAYVALYADSSLAKVETTDDAGVFRMSGLKEGSYDLVVTFLGYEELRRENLDVSDGVDLGILRLSASGVELETATVTADRALVEVKPDRTVFNVQGTINASGNNGLDLLRMAPGVSVDNNENINVLSRSGVLLYVDGKRLPLSGQDMSNYLRSLTAEQIDRIDIITSPGAKYEAQGNAGIIDIRLKKAENEGANGSVSSAFSQGKQGRLNVNANGNYRSRKLNVFGSAGFNDFNNLTVLEFGNFQNNLFIDRVTEFEYRSNTPDYRIGIDYFINKRHTVGFLIGGRHSNQQNLSSDNAEIFSFAGGELGSRADSILRATVDADNDSGQNTLNLNYRYEIAQGRSLNADLDYGRYRTDMLRQQPNRYFSADGSPLSSIINYFDTPTNIDIATAKIDYEQPLCGGSFEIGTKMSSVRTENTFLFFDVPASQRILNRQRSNQFDYQERVYAAYLSFSAKLNERINYKFGLRAELTDADGVLTPFESNLAEDPVELNYLSFFPNAGLTYQLDQQKGNTINLNYGRRINRPDYNVLNPFRNQVSQLSYERGNPFLSPEIVDNVELGYTHAYRYNFKLAYSQTANQITRLLGPDDVDPRAGFISWDNLANQTVISFSVSAPIQLKEWWNLYLNATAYRQDNQADYGENGGVIDLQATSYSFYAQNTFKLPGDFTAEVGGYFSGPGIWGGVFRYEESGSLNIGVQRKFLKDQLNVKLSANDILLTSPWRGVSVFNGLKSFGRGRWDSRRAGISLSYNFGNDKVKSRKRDTGLEDEQRRIGS